jgi:hypothetical protein
MPSLLETTKLLLNFNGTDGAASTVDTSSNSYDISFFGTAQLDTDQKKFGTSSLFLDGNSDYITVPDSDDWSFGNGDFTVECWFQAIGTANNTHILLSYGTYNANGAWNLIARVSDGKVQFYCKDASGTMIILSGTGKFIADNWYHLAVVRYGNIWSLYCEGTLIQSVTSAITLPNIERTLEIGYNDLAPGYYFNGHIDSIRIIKGYAVYTEEFIPPSEEFYLVGNVYQSLEIPFNIGSAVSNTLKMDFSILVAVSKTLNLLFDIGHSVFNNVNVLFSSQQYVSNTLRIPFFINNSISQSIQILFNNGNLIVNELSFPFSSMAYVQKSLNMPFNQGINVSNEVELDFNSIAYVTKSLNLPFNIGSSVNNNCEMIFGAGGRISQSINMPFQGRWAVYKKFRTLNDSLEYVSNILNVPFSSFHYVSSSITLPFISLRVVNNEVDITFNSFEYVYQELEILFNILNPENHSRVPVSLSLVKIGKVNMIIENKEIVALKSLNKI